METNESMLSIFYELQGRLPTVEEAQDFVEYLVLINQFDAGKAVPTPEYLRQEQVKELLGADAELIDVDTIFERFNCRIAGVTLDRMIQEAVYYWRVGDNYYADNLEHVKRIAG